MLDKTTIGNNENANTPSKAFREYIESLVEEIVVNKAVFNDHKKYLQRYSQEESLDYTELEKNLTDFFDAVEELKSNKSKSIERFAKMLAKDCYLEDSVVNNLVLALNKAREETEQRARDEAERVVREKRAKEEAERKAREERERRIQEEAERKAREERERKGREEAKHKVKDEVPKTLFVKWGSLYTSEKVSGRVVIPSTVGGETVTAIGASAFARNSIESVVLPDTLIRIDESAFEGCHALKVVVIPISTSIRIEESAFRNCDNLTRIDLPYKLNYIAPNVFSGCKKLTEINIPDGVGTIGREAFRDCPLKSVDLPNSLRSIEGMAFYGCINIPSLIVPDRVSRIEDFAFGNCVSLKSIVIPNTVLSLSKYALSGCTNLQEIRIGRKNYERIKDNIPSPHVSVHFID